MTGQKQALKNGILIFLLIGLYFILLEALGLTDNISLRFVNFFFVLVGVNNTLKHVSKEKANYLQKFKAGVLTVFIGIALSTIALFAYLELFDAELNQYAMTIFPAHTNIAFAGTIFVEGFVSSLMVVFIMLQYWKNVNPPKDSQ
ncbi:MAG: hypothetical protein R3277_13050 [Brumimicrobium sp.]|nr:hypothetical protein [Brumimicrobium sp.]